MAGDFEKRLVVLEPNAILRAILLGLLGGGPLLFLLAITGVFPIGFFGIHMTILGAVLYWGFRRHNQRAQKKERNVRANKEGIFVDGKLVVVRTAIKDGYFQPRTPGGGEKYGSSVRIVDKRRRILFEAELLGDEALSFLRALGFDAGKRRAEFGGGSPMFATVGRQVATSFGSIFAGLLLSTAGAAIVGPAASFAIFLLFPMLIAAMWPSKITIGIDGVLVRWLWTSRFFPMKDIRGVSEADDNAIRLILHPYEERVIYTSMRHRQSQSLIMRNNRDAIIARIREAHLRFQEGGGAIDATALVARGRQKRSEWLDALAKLARREGGYRDAVVRPEDLLRIVEDPRASEDARAGAAFVLRTTADDDMKARVRVAAEASASPKLRVALDATATGDEAKIEEAMQELAVDDEAPPAARI